MATYTRVLVSAPAKINLTLDITGRLNNGYHAIETVMHAVSLRDAVLVGRHPGRDIRVSCSRDDLPRDRDNIAWKAAAAFLQAAGSPAEGLWIHIDKQIPAQAGLAGGSADAAAVLLGLNVLLEAGLPPDRLLAIGKTVGADVPFCLAGGCRLATGIGERLSPLPPLTGCALVLAKPAAGMDTAQAYRFFDSRTEPLARPDTAAMVRALEASDLPAVGGFLANVFEELVSLDPVAALKAAMGRHGALGAVMSGSGTAVAGLFRDQSAAQSCADGLDFLATEVHLAAPLSTGPEILALL